MTEEVSAVGMVAKEVIAKYKAYPQKAIDQIEWCGYECEGGTVKTNVAWVAIKEMLAELATLRQKQEPCEWCNGDFEIAGLFTNSEGGFGQQAHFCPVCGRDLSRKEGTSRHGEGYDNQAVL